MINFDKAIEANLNYALLTLTGTSIQLFFRSVFCSMYFYIVVARKYSISRNFLGTNFDHKLETVGT